MEINLIGVAGAGTMGAGIAQAAAQAGLEVRIADQSMAVAERAIAGIAAGLARMVARGRLDEAERSAIVGRIRPAAFIGELAGAPLVIEAVIEVMAVKSEVLRELDAAAGPSTILASNTSTLPITELAAATARPDRVIGMHFFNPVHAMKLVEVIRGLRTSDDTVEAVRTLAQRLGKTPVVVNDGAGFVSNRLLAPMINEAIYALMQGVGSREDIDTIMKLGANHPMGPLELADLIGLDVCLDILLTLHRSFGDKFLPAPLLRQMVAAGQLGRKTGRGFYQYD
ncbi:MAG: 3-hydroxyacyl-CoA dehydrogenase NAD-binding domain-containing protein [Chloroflexi bacterium]|nr:3-hydroxyacyl-CoA dehydrogenase NAD-binding domain-containing protein [Chloroflexota bacterium]